MVRTGSTALVSCSLTHGPVATRAYGHWAPLRFQSDRAHLRARLLEVLEAHGTRIPAEGVARLHRCAIASADDDGHGGFVARSRGCAARDSLPSPQHDNAR